MSGSAASEKTQDRREEPLTLALSPPVLDAQKTGRGEGTKPKSEEEQDESGGTASPGLWLPVYTLALRELVRFFRQRTRVVGALGQPDRKSVV